jgi:hypothetical protein
MCLYLWHRGIGNDQALSIFIFWFASMQLFEFFMWQNMQDHSFVSKLSFVFILLQPFVLVASLYYFSIYNNNKYSITEKLVLGLTAFVSFMKTIAGAHYAFISQSVNKWLSIKGPHCHLMWWFSRNYKKIPGLARTDLLWLMLLFIGLIMIKPFQQGLIYFIFAFISVLVSRLLYPRENGSIWCWLANFMGIVAIAMPLFTSLEEFKQCLGSASSSL